MNCLQFFIFTRFFAVETISRCPNGCCELLTIFYLYKVLCSRNKDLLSPYFVVNCLQFFIFTRFFAVIMKQYPDKYLLWIAYNFLSLQGSLQSNYHTTKFSNCCELLTIFYLYKVLCSPGHLRYSDKWVVNCLQFFIFTRFFAVTKRFHSQIQRLWIAYNFLSLQGSLQSALICMCLLSRCELLTIFYLYKVLCSELQLL